MVVVFLILGLWLKVIKNERSLRRGGMRGETLSCAVVPESVCVRAEWMRAWALLVTRASFIMSDDINHKADSTKWRNRYEPDLSPVIKLR